MEVKLSLPALVRPGLSVKPAHCRTKFLSENWRFRCEEEIQLDYENRSNHCPTSVALSSNQMELGSEGRWLDV